MDDTGSYITNDDCRNIENTVNDWIEQGNSDPEKHDAMQNKVKGAVSILNKIDNIKVSTTRNNKDDDIQEIGLQAMY